jgi:peptide/nickel transport system permease protein
MSSLAVGEDAGLAGVVLAGEKPRSTRRSGFGLWGGSAIVGLVILATIVVHVGGIGQPDRLDLLKTLEAPSLAHPFGTDAQGRDVLLRTIYGGGLDLQVGFITTLVPLLAGMGLGVVSGFFGGRLDAIVMRVIDAILAFPFVVLVIGFVTIFGVGMTGVYVGLIVGGVPVFARLTRGEMLVLREQQFMMAARTLGYSTRRILLKHAYPHLIRPNLVFVPSNMLGNILAVTALSYLGLGVQPPTPEWGAIISEGQSYLLTSWWISTLPGLFVVVVGVGFSLIGDGLAERLRARTG